MRHEESVDVPGDANSVIGKSHSGTAHEEEVRDDPPTFESVS